MISHWKLLYILAHYGYGALAGLLALGVFGLPVPDEFLLIFSGYLVYTGKLKFIPIIIAAFIGSIIGITVTYLLGFFVGKSAINKFTRLGITEKRLARVHKWFDKFGKLVIPAGYFIPAIRSMIAFFAAVSFMPYREFAVCAYPGGFFWIVLYICVGWYLGKDWVAARSLVHHFNNLGLGLFILIMIGIAIWLLGHPNKEENHT
ncbi:MAG TPA: DedA family protein [Syntrophomonadaceae bacterium]|nr:DedA family protein [Syntrophomonadaceae bacterium]